jgi:hypothetical protein
MLRATDAEEGLSDGEPPAAAVLLEVVLVPGSLFERRLLAGSFLPQAESNNDKHSAPAKTKFVFLIIK